MLPNCPPGPIGRLKGAKRAMNDTPLVGLVDRAPPGRSKPERRTLKEMQRVE